MTGAHLLVRPGSHIAVVSPLVYKSLRCSGVNVNTVMTCMSVGGFGRITAATCVNPA